MGKTNVASTGWLALLFNAIPFLNIAIDSTSSPLTHLYVSLHTADPGALGFQTTNEVAYNPYVRIGVERTTRGWKVKEGSVSPVADIVFPRGIDGSGPVTHFGIGSLPFGAGVLFYSGELDPIIQIGRGVAPFLSTETIITEK